MEFGASELKWSRAWGDDRAMASLDDGDRVWKLAGRVGGEKSKAKRPRVSASGRARLRRIVNRTPEVVVKLTGRTRKGPLHLKKHLDYISRNMSLTVTTQDGEKITSRVRLRELNDAWLVKNALDERARPKAGAAQSVSIILSMAPETPADKVEEAAHRWVRQILHGKYDYVMVRHDPIVDPPRKTAKGETGTKRPHVHVTVRAVGYDGKRLAPGPEALQRWREVFAQELRDGGIEAEATPRQARGVVQKSMLSGPVYHMEKKARAKGTPMPKVLEQAQREAERAAQGPKREPNTHERKIAARQDWIKKTYLAQADELERGSAEDRRLARDLRKFVGDQPLPLTRRRELEAHIRDAQDRVHGRQTPDFSRPSEPRR